MDEQIRAELAALGLNADELARLESIVAERQQREKENS